jgi:hypothetical protein
MTEDRKGEGGLDLERTAAPEPARSPRRESPLLARSPVFAALAVVLAGWLLWSLWPEVAYHFSSRAPIDLGAPGAYHLDAARAGRLVHVQGRLVDAVPVTGRAGAPRTVGRLAGTNLLVDRPGRPGQVELFEGRLLAAPRRDEYREVAGIIEARGTPLGDRWQVLYDGERPRHAWWHVLGAVLLLCILALNLRALLRPLLPPPRELR